MSSLSFRLYIYRTTGNGQLLMALMILPPFNLLLLLLLLLINRHLG